VSEASSPAEIRGTYSLTEKDLYDAQVRHTGWQLIFRQVLGGIFVTTGMVALITQQYPQAALPVVLGTFFIFALRLSTKSTFKKDFASRFETTVVASDAQIEFSNAKGNAVFNWMAIVRYAESKQLFLLYTQSNVFNVIPKRRSRRRTRPLCGKSCGGMLEPILRAILG
jgi:hypothetical protein